MCFSCSFVSVSKPQIGYYHVPQTAYINGCSWLQQHLRVTTFSEMHKDFFHLCSFVCVQPHFSSVHTLFLHGDLIG